MSSISVNTITDASGGATTSINGFTPSVSNMAGRNRIINGDMRIDQRNAGAAVTLNTWSGQFPVDRFRGNVRPSTGTISAQQSTVVPSGQDFSNSVKLTQASVTTQAANDVYSFVHTIEGYNAQSFQFGTSGAKELVLSFWVRSSVTGTYCVSFQNSLLDRRSLVKEYTISVADTWQKINISFLADSTGTWSIDNSVGLYIFWDLGGGIVYQTTPNSWTSGEYRSSANQVRWIDTSGATFYITGVQLEAGSVATPFEHRQYGQELALCQRYYWQQTLAEQGNKYTAFAGVQNTSSIQTMISMPATMRVDPTITTSSFAQNNLGATPTGVSGSTFNGNSLRLGLTVSGATANNVGNVSFDVTLSSEL